MLEVHPDVEYVMLTQQQISKKVKAVAKQLDKLYENRKPVVICILKGSVVFFSDLIRNMKTPLSIDFMSVSSYGSGTKSTGELTIKKDLSVDIKGRDVLIVEDIDVNCDNVVGDFDAVNNVLLIIIEIFLH